MDDTRQSPCIECLSLVIEALEHDLTATSSTLLSIVMYTPHDRPSNTFPVINGVSFDGSLTSKQCRTHYTVVAGE